MEYLTKVKWFLRFLRKNFIDLYKFLFVRLFPGEITPERRPETEK